MKLLNRSLLDIHIMTLHIKERRRRIDMKIVKSLIGLLVLAGSLAGCATPVMVTDGVHRRAFIPCANDEFCFRSTYGIVRDNYCSDFPVAYRNDDREFNTTNFELIYQPGSFNR